MAARPKRVREQVRTREQVMVYLDARDRALLERVAKKTGLARTELLRRGLHHIASIELADEQPGSAFEYLIASGVEDAGPPDLSARPDDYLYGGGYKAWFDRKPPMKKAKCGRVR